MTTSTSSLPSARLVVLLLYRMQENLRLERVDVEATTCSKIKKQEGPRTEINQHRHHIEFGHHPVLIPQTTMTTLYVVYYFSHY